MFKDLKTWEKKHLHSKRSRAVIALYARLLLERGSAAKLTQEDWFMLGKLLYPGATAPAKWVRLLVFSRIGQHMTHQELERLLRGKGITAESVIDNYLQLHERALKEGKLNVAKGILDRFAKMLGMESVPEQQQQPLTLEAHLTKVVGYVASSTASETESRSLSGPAAPGTTDSTPPLPSGEPSDAP